MISKLSHAGRTTTVVIALGLLGTLGADIAAAASSGNNGVPAAGHHAGSHSDDAAVRAYLTALRPVAVHVADAVGPAQGVLDYLNEPHAGDAFAARDALANGDALSRLATARRQLAALHAPAAMAAHQRALVAAGKQMAAALTDVRTLRALGNGSRILGRIEGGVGSDLAWGEGRWNAALDAAYASSQISEPGEFRDYAHDAANRTKWIFGADRACSAASFKLANLRKYDGAVSVSAFSKVARLWSTTLSWTGRRLTGLRQPGGASALPYLLRSHLRSLAYNAKLFDLELQGVKAQNLAKVTRSADRIHELMPSLRLLASAMNRYGAKTCGLVIGLWSGKRLPNFGGSSHHAPLNA